MYMCLGKFSVASRDEVEPRFLNDQSSKLGASWGAGCRTKLVSFTKKKLGCTQGKGLASGVT